MGRHDDLDKRTLEGPGTMLAGASSALPPLLDPLRYGALPVFPLPEFALFPHTLAPFHVFEPRYLDMLDHCLADRRLLVVVGLEPGWEERWPQDARTYEVGGLGRIVSDRKTRDGRTNVFVHCMERVQILREASELPPSHRGGEASTSAKGTRFVDVEPLEDFGHEAGTSDAHHRLSELVGNLAREMAADGGALGKVLASTADPAILTHRLASMVVDDPAERQRLLVSRSVMERCALLSEHVVRCLLERTPAATEEAGWTH